MILVTIVIVSNATIHGNLKRVVLPLENPLEVGQYLLNANNGKPRAFKIAYNNRKLIIAYIKILVRLFGQARQSICYFT